MCHHFSLSCVSPRTFLRVLGLADRLPLGARVVERLRLWRELIMLAMLTASICCEGSGSRLLLRLRRQRFLDLGAIVDPL